MKVYITPTMKVYILTKFLHSLVYILNLESFESKAYNVQSTLSLQYIMWSATVLKWGGGALAPG